MTRRFDAIMCIIAALLCGWLVMQSCSKQELPTAPESRTAQPPVEVEGRSGSWRRVRAEHLEVEPVCIVCGTDEDLEVHHIKPFNEYPELELDPENLVTLCREHHFTYGHDADGPDGPARPNWQTSNPRVREHAEAIR